MRNCVQDRETSRSPEIRHLLLAFFLSVAIGMLLLGAIAGAQSGGGRPGTPPKVQANMLQLMRGILYPSSNVIFAARSDLSKLTPAADPSVSPDPLTSTYGGWPAVENAALALVEAANLIVLPGRMCSNGRPAPVQRADWVKYTQGLREAGMAAYKAAQSKSQDAIVDVSGTVSDACSACHDVYREKKGGVADRCLP